MKPIIAARTQDASNMLKIDFNKKPELQAETGNKKIN